MLEIINEATWKMDQDVTNWIGKRIPPLVKLADLSYFFIAGENSELYHMVEQTGFPYGLESLVYHNRNKFGPLIEHVNDS